MTNGATTWVTVKEAADEVGTTEARLRSAYRSGKLGVQDVRVAGRVRKMVALDEVKAWASGQPLASKAVEVAEPVPAAAPLAAVAAVAAPAEAEPSRYDELLEMAEKALARSARAESQVAFLRNELAHLRASHDRIQEDLDRKNAEHFRATARLAVADALTRPQRGGIRRILAWRISA